MSQDIKDQVLDQVRASPVFAIQLDEMTDVAQCSQLLMYARFVSGNSVKEEMLFCHLMESYATATDIFKWSQTSSRKINFCETRWSGCALRELRPCLVCNLVS